MADIQSLTAEIRRGKKRKKIETTRQKYNGLPYYIGDHKNPGGTNIHPIYRKTKMVAMATFLSCRVSPISAFWESLRS